MSPGILQLSPAEIEVLAYVSLGYTSARIGDELGISDAAVRQRLKNVYYKLGARNAAHAVAIYMREQS